MGSLPLAREGGGQAELQFQAARRTLGGHSESAVQSDWNTARSSYRWLRREDDQHSPALGSGSAGLLRFSGIRYGGFRWGTGRNAGSGIADSCALSRRLHYRRTGTALPAGIFSGGVLAG